MLSLARPGRRPPIIDAGRRPFSPHRRSAGQPLPPGWPDPGRRAGHGCPARPPRPPDASRVAGSVRDRSQARGVEYVGDRPSGHYVHDPGLRDSEDVGSGEAGERGGDFLAGQRGEHRIDGPAELLGRHAPAGRQRMGRSLRAAAVRYRWRHCAAPPRRPRPAWRCGMAVPSGNLKPDRCLGRPGPALRPAIRGA